MNTAAETRPTATRALDRGLVLLRCLSDADEGLTAPELAQRSNINRATVYRMLQTLEQRGFARIDESSRKYFLGPTVERLSLGPESKLALSAIAAPHLKQLSEMTSESVGLHVRNGTSRSAISKVEPDSQPLRYVIDVNMPRPLARGASGAVLLMGEPRERIVQILTSDGLAADEIERQADFLERRIEAVSQQGFCEAVSESVTGLASLAAPIYGSRSNVIAALALSGPVSRFDEQGREHAIQHVLATAQRISEVMRLSSDEL